MSHRSNLLAFWSGIIIFGAAGVFCFLFGAQELLNGYRSRSWTEVSGEVLSSKLTGQSSTSSNTSTASYSAEILYRYRVEDRAYESDRIRFGAVGGSEARARSFADRYPAGAEVRVFHHPQRPEESVLEPGWTWRSLAFMLVGLPLCGLAYLFFRLRVHA